MEHDPDRILVIDDEETDQDGLRRILSREGYLVDGALNGAQGLEMMFRTPYRAVIVDLLMPEMDGLGLMEEMRRRGLNIPTVMITSYPTIKTAFQALRLGAVDYIPKSYTGKELLGLLSRVLRRKECAWGACDFEPDRSLSFTPGEKYTLPKHSWARLREDGLVEVGLRNSFLEHLPEIDAVQAPEIDELVEQGHPGLELTASGEVHQVFMPLSGRVKELNGEALGNPSALDSEIWLIRLLPRNLEEELAELRPEPD